MLKIRKEMLGWNPASRDSGDEIDRWVSSSRSAAKSGTCFFSSFFFLIKSCFVRHLKTV